MRIAKVIGKVTLSKRDGNMPNGSLLLAEVLDKGMLNGQAKRATPMPESLVVYDHLGAGAGQIIGVSEGAEATMPFRPRPVPLDAYCAAIFDNIQITEK
jgi:ethanolamine utilization protein EutN